MNKRIIQIAEQALFAIVIFVLVLLLFEDRIVVPVWLQPLGRMHPLLLHFPIVLLLLAMVMEVFRFGRNSYGEFLSSLLLVGTLSAGLTVIMGLFLSREDGYTGSVLQWHKWTGVGIFFLSALVYWARKKAWYTTRIAQFGALATVVCLVGAGHYGATLTHGDNFLFKPLSSNAQAEPVPLDQAVVFNDVILPIFEQKCMSCHNPDKLKGQLSLVDAESIRKGGKTGKLFVAGRPDISLLLQRVHLSLDEKKHMPPSGKTQLTPQEIQLLTLWVKGRAEFDKRVVDLPPTDSLRFVAASLFKPVQAVEEYDFEAPDEEVVKDLNNDYRTVAFLARESPALAVNLYSRAAYNPEQLDELSPVKEQIVSLSLNKLPVKDADLKRVRPFENLQKLDLNFTDITGNGLAELTSLKVLKTLALSGTKVSFADLQKQIGGFKNLKTVSLWNTALTPAQITQLQKANAGIQFISGFDGAASKPITLNPPQLKNPSPIFTESILVQLKHPIKGVQIRYTTDGTEPDSVNSPILGNQTVISQPTRVKARAYKEGWFGSNTATFDYYKSIHKPDSVNLLFPLNRVHQVGGAAAFFDGILGTFSANSPAWANNWLGVRNNDLALVSEFRKPVNVSSVALRIMVEEETNVLPPATVEIWGGNSRDQMKLLGKLKPAQPAKREFHELKAITCSFKPQTVSFLKIVAKPVAFPPDEKTGKPKSALVLVDEIFIN
ncbi:MAG: cytochrome C [Cytophagales bacterium]|nr:MAG: cytochrome C [Cytophagales bacterium]